jgi:hypothetical protein
MLNGAPQRIEADATITLRKAMSSTTVPASILRQNLVSQVVAGVARTNAQYLPLFWPNVNTVPILFWGDPTTAQYATFGVNPSADEFKTGRWPNKVTVPQLDHRSVNYFTNAVAPDDWFEGYEDTRNASKVLNVLGHSYRHNTVHIDLTPRATIAVETISKNPALRTLFLQMVAADIQWFFSTIALCSNLKGAIMSGTVTNAHYFDKFLKKHLPTGYSLKPNTPFGSGKGATMLYDFSGPGFSIPLFFCRKSPSDRQDRGTLLAKEVTGALTQLRAVGF